ncbi:hypothetical protein SESBI_33788 [Sesbania bispinosa]|nr:hypothetical protein SESBI_33788 [Sesbania bispinosa]
MAGARGMQGHRPHHRRLDLLIGPHRQIPILVTLAHIDKDAPEQENVLGVHNEGLVDEKDPEEKEVGGRDPLEQKLEVIITEIKGLAMLRWAQVQKPRRILIQLRLKQWLISLVFPLIAPTLYHSQIGS